MLPEGAVTFLFTDIEGSTRLWQDNASTMRDALAVHDQIIRQAVEGHDGVIFKTGGDSFCVSFGDPGRALEAAIAAQRELLAADWETTAPLKVRMGLHTGTAQVRENDYFGPTLNRAARIMSIGHGGQIICSTSTERLLADEPPAGVSFQRLGTHYLKDLDRPEEIFQVHAPDLPARFPPLRSESEAGGPADEAVAAYQRKDWKKAVDLLEKLEIEGALDAGQQEMMGFASWWLGRHDEVFRRLELAHEAYVAEGNPQRAAIVAVELADMHKHNLSPDLAAGWISRATRLLADDSDSVAKGYLLRWQAIHAFESEGDLETALELAERVGEIGRANADGNLEVLSLQDHGRFLVAVGRLDEGMPFMDEAMTAALAGDISPLTVGRSYCNMLAVCDKTGDLRRASEWTGVAERWCRESESSPYPGICRIFKAELLWLNGKWVEAESEVKKASTELGLYTDITGEAWYQYGVMRLRAGDQQGAEQAFQEALTHGREPVPGYAYILADKGEREAAIDLIQRTLAESGLTKLDRAGFLPALIELLTDAGDLETATEATAELGEIAELARSDFYRAQTERALGMIDQANGDHVSAVEHLRLAVRKFSELSLPYEAAEARRDLARAYLSDGSQALADMELRAAETAFERLGSSADVAATRKLLEAHRA